jgi:hypothetical protein
VGSVHHRRSFPPKEKAMSITDKLSSMFRPTPPDLDYEAVAKHAEMQTAVLGQAQVYVTNGGSSGNSWATIPPRYVDPHTQNISDVGMIFMRMRDNGTSMGDYPKRFDYIATHRITAEKVAVFVCNNGSYVVLEDNTDLFPSDTLITQLRMLQK